MGDEQRGTVVGVSQTTRRGGGVTCDKVTVEVRYTRGVLVQGEIEEAEGTDLPQVEEGADATVSTSGGRSVTATRGALFEQPRA